jgi:16S rRNA (cytidine1402-2'-O)-methyltransferase
MVDRVDDISGPSRQPGTLYVVATPIGNRDDLSPRARMVLESVDLIAAEDTRHSGQFLQSFGIRTPLTALHEHNETDKLELIIARLQAGASVALISDAGTPLISDPGFQLLARARRAGLRTIAVAGPCAAIAALSVAGLPTDRFVFEGFLPSKSTARRARLTELHAEPGTLIFYEAPHRLGATLQDMVVTLGGEREASVSRELTKRFETNYYGTLGQLAMRATQEAELSRGEAVIVVAGNSAPPTAALLDSERILTVLCAELPAAQAAKLTAKLTGAKRAELYERAVARARGPNEPGPVIEE